MTRAKDVHSKTRPRYYYPKLRKWGRLCSCYFTYLSMITVLKFCYSKIVTCGCWSFIRLTTGSPVKATRVRLWYCKKDFIQWSATLSSRPPQVLYPTGSCKSSSWTRLAKSLNSIRDPPILHTLSLFLSFFFERFFPLKLLKAVSNEQRRALKFLW